jgi:nucleoid DNA-binding protein
MVYPQTRRIYEEVARELNLPMDLVEKVLDSQFKFVKEVMAQGEKNKPETFKTIQLTHLGKFAVRKRKIEYYKRKLKMSVPEGLEFNKSYDIIKNKNEKH